MAALNVTVRVDAQEYLFRTKTASSVVVCFREVLAEQSLSSSDPVFVTASRGDASAAATKNGGGAFLTVTLPVTKSGVYCVDQFVCGVTDGWPGVNHTSRGYIVADSQSSSLEPVMSPATITVIKPFEKRLVQTENALSRLSLYERALMDFKRTSRDQWLAEVQRFRVGTALASNPDMAYRCHLHTTLGPDAKLPHEFFFRGLADISPSQMWRYLEKCAEAVTSTMLDDRGDPWALTESPQDYHWLVRLICAYCHAVAYIPDKTESLPERDDVFEIVSDNRSGDCEDMSAMACATMLALQGPVPHGHALSPTLQRLRKVAAYYKAYVVLLTVNGKCANTMVHLVPILIRESGPSSLPPSLLAEATNMHAALDLNLARKQAAAAQSPFARNYFCAVKGAKACDKILTESMHLPVGGAQQPPWETGQKSYVTTDGRSENARGWYGVVIEMFSADRQLLALDSEGQIGVAFTDLMNSETPNEIISRFHTRQSSSSAFTLSPISHHPLSTTAPWATDFVATVGLQQADQETRQFLATLPTSPPHSRPKSVGMYATLSCAYWCLVANLSQIKKLLTSLAKVHGEVWVNVHDVDLLVGGGSDCVRRVSFMVNMLVQTTTLHELQHFVEGGGSSLPRGCVLRVEHPQTMLQESFNGNTWNTLTKTFHLSECDSTTFFHPRVWGLTTMSSSAPCFALRHVGPTSVLLDDRQQGDLAVVEQKHHPHVQAVTRTPTSLKALRAAALKRPADVDTATTELEHLSLGTHEATHTSTRNGAGSTTHPTSDDDDELLLCGGWGDDFASNLLTEVRCFNPCTPHVVQEVASGESWWLHLIPVMYHHPASHNLELLEKFIATLERVHSMRDRPSFFMQFVQLTIMQLAQITYEDLHRFHSASGGAEYGVGPEKIKSLKRRLQVIYDPETVAKEERTTELHKTVARLREEKAQRKLAETIEKLEHAAQQPVKRPRLKGGVFTETGIARVTAMYQAAFVAHHSPVTIARTIETTTRSSSWFFGYLLTFLTQYVVTRQWPSGVERNPLWYYNHLRLLHVADLQLTAERKEGLRNVLVDLHCAGYQISPTELRAVKSALVRSVSAIVDTQTIPPGFEALLLKSPHTLYCLFDVMRTVSAEKEALLSRVTDHARQVSHDGLKRALFLIESFAYGMMRRCPECASKDWIDACTQFRLELQMSAVDKRPNQRSLYSRPGFSGRAGSNEILRPGPKGGKGFLKLNVPRFPDPELLKHPSVQAIVADVDATFHPNNKFDEHPKRFQDRIMAHLSEVPGATQSVWKYIVAKASALDTYVTTKIRQEDQKMIQWYKNTAFAKWMGTLMHRMWPEVQHIINGIEHLSQEAVAEMKQLEQDVKDVIARYKEIEMGLEDIDAYGF